MYARNAQAVTSADARLSHELCDNLVGFGRFTQPAFDNGNLVLRMRADLIEQIVTIQRPCLDN
jgi:hypothetical protein